MKRHLLPFLFTLGLATPVLAEDTAIKRAYVEVRKNGELWGYYVDTNSIRNVFGRGIVFDFDWKFGFFRPDGIQIGRFQPGNHKSPARAVCDFDGQSLLDLKDYFGRHEYPLVKRENNEWWTTHEIWRGYRAPISPTAEERRLRTRRDKVHQSIFDSVCEK